MAYTVRIERGYARIVETSFNCPKCKKLFHEDFYIKAMDKSSSGLVYKRCTGCKTTIGITADILGDVRVWEKKTEKK